MAEQIKIDAFVPFKNQSVAFFWFTRVITCNYIGQWVLIQIEDWVIEKKPGNTGNVRSKICYLPLTMSAQA
jgi:adenine-specific DNA methylase